MECFYFHASSLSMITEKPELTQIQFSNNCVIKSLVQKKISKVDILQPEGRALNVSAIKVAHHPEVNPYLTHQPVIDTKCSSFPSFEVVAVMLKQESSLLQGIKDLDRFYSKNSMEQHEVWRIFNHLEFNGGGEISFLIQLLSKASPERSFILDILSIDSQNVDRTYIVPDGIGVLEELYQFQNPILTHNGQETLQILPNQSTGNLSFRSFQQNTTHQEVWASIKQKTIELVDFSKKHSEDDGLEFAGQRAATKKSVGPVPAIIHQITGIMADSDGRTSIAFMVIPAREGYVLIANLVNPLEKHRKPFCVPDRVLMKFYTSISLKTLHGAYKRLIKCLGDIHVGFYSIYFGSLDLLFSSFSLNKQLNKLENKSITGCSSKLVYIKTEDSD